MKASYTEVDYMARDTRNLHRQDDESHESLVFRQVLHGDVSPSIRVDEGGQSNGSGDEEENCSHATQRRSGIFRVHARNQPAPGHHFHSQVPCWLHKPRKKQKKTNNLLWLKNYMTFSPPTMKNKRPLANCKPQKEQRRNWLTFLFSAMIPRMKAISPGTVNIAAKVDGFPNAIAAAAY